MRLAGLFFVLVSVATAADSISLAGSWNIRLDPAKGGATGTIFLPGTTDEGGYGTKTSGPEKGWLSRPFTYEGRAWYERDVVIPEVWRGRRITLFLERTHWSTEVAVDGKTFGSRDSLTTPHEYDLTPALTPGKHRITICVDNGYLVPVGHDAHSVTEHTQTNWNGIIGKIELRAGSAVWIEDVRVSTDARAGRVRVSAVVRGGGGEMEVLVDGVSRAKSFATAGETSNFEFPFDGARWDEWDGVLHHLTVRLGGDHVDLDFGMRDIAKRGTQFTLNGRPILLRGTLECSIFPRTGHPPTTVDEWARLFANAREYGLNHFRFHSWCPPEAAFVAADRAGFLLQIELPVWSAEVGKNAQLNEYMRAEGHRMLKTYGNHPSFTMLSLGNELRGDFAFMDGLVAEFQKADPRRLYTFSSDYVRKQPGPVSDYYVAQSTIKQRLRIQGVRFEERLTGTDVDFAESVAAVPVPLVAHELGQWVTYPSYDEISRYTGVLKPRNLEAFRNKLEERGMIDQARDFQTASGKFAWRLYKEDIESVMRTPGMGGFQLLQLQDFPGQGEALIGLLDSFWESKGLMTPAGFRRFVNDTVALLRMKKFVWRSDETFSVTAELAHYGKKPIEERGRWRVEDDGGSILAHGELTAARVNAGSVAPLGEVRMPLAAFSAKPAHLRVIVEFGAIHNDWDFWVYPASPVAPTPAADVLLTSDVEAARAALAAGRKVLLTAPPSDKMQPIRFLPVFWSLTWFPKQPGTMGILCDPAHPALRGFPTAMHSDFQWWELTESARAFVLNDAPAGLRPIVQVIDDYHRNHRLGAVVEARVGQGKLLATSLDLRTDLEHRPVARQLLRSLLDYVESADFVPQTEAALDSLLGR